MAMLLSPSLKIDGNPIDFEEVNVHLSAQVAFSDLDRQLEMNYSIQAFVYDVDSESDIIIPLIKSAHCFLHNKQIADSSGNEDDLIQENFHTRINPSRANYRFEKTFIFQKKASNFSPGTILVSPKVSKALKDEKDIATLELKALFVLTNELNGLAIGESAIVSTKVMTMYAG